MSNVVEKRPGAPIVQTVEPQYQNCLDIEARFGRATLGLMTNQVWHDDPRRLTFVLARYKFVAKMLSGRDHVLEVGCADAFGTRIVQQEVGHVTALDIDPVLIDDARKRIDPEWPLDFIVHDILDTPLANEFDAAYSLDVLEHIVAEDEDQFVSNIAASLKTSGVAIIGSPSLNSQQWASPTSKAGHINCKQAGELKSLLERHFDNVFVFSMNDEVVHTGYFAMAHYYFALCCGRRR